jgi:transposase
VSLRVRDMTPEEVESIRHLARSRTDAARLVERAKIVWLSRQGRTVNQIAAELHVCRNTVRSWLRRFDETGLPGLQDGPRPGCPATYSREQAGVVIATALTAPQTLGLAFACWTLDRLQVYLNDVAGIAIKRTRIRDMLQAEGLRWRQQETWFGERVDPDFAEKRGLSPACTKSHPRTA